MAASQWNSAGTWEERDHSDWARKRLKVLLDGHELVPGISVTTVKTCRGDARVLHLRGRDRVGFELTVELAFEGNGVKGTVHAEEVSETDLDSIELDVMYTARGSSANVGEFEDALQTKISAILRQLHDEILARQAAK